jgi:hypothetical protein
MRSYVVYGTLEKELDMAIDSEWMSRFEHIDVFYDDNIGIIYGIKCVLTTNGTISFTESQKNSLDEFITIYKRKVPDAICGYFTGIIAEDIDCLAYYIYDLEEYEEEKDEDE